MKGCVYKRTSASGAVTWAYSVDAGKDEHGKRLREFHGGFDRKKDAEGQLARVLQEAQDGLLVKPSPETFGEFMADWFKEHAQRHCSPKTIERYRQLWKYAAPMLSGLQLREVSTLALERLYNRLMESGGKGRKKAERQTTKPLSARTVRHVAGLIHVALNTALRWKLLKMNPATACQLPRLERKEARALDSTQAESLLSAAQGHWLHPLIVLALATGCRRGELLALTWTDARLDSTPGVLAVSKSLEQTKEGLRIKKPKNGKVRAFPLPTVAVEDLMNPQDKPGTAQEAIRERVPRRSGLDIRRARWSLPQAGFRDGRRVPARPQDRVAGRGPSQLAPLARLATLERWRTAPRGFQAPWALFGEHHGSNLLPCVHGR